MSKWMLPNRSEEIAGHEDPHWVRHRRLEFGHKYGGCDTEPTCTPDPDQRDDPNEHETKSEQAFCFDGESTRAPFVASNGSVVRELPPNGIVYGIEIEPTMGKPSTIFEDELIAIREFLNRDERETHPAYWHKNAPCDVLPIITESETPMTPRDEARQVADALSAQLPQDTRMHTLLPLARVGARLLTEAALLGTQNSTTENCAIYEFVEAVAEDEGVAAITDGGRLPDFYLALAPLVGMDPVDYGVRVERLRFEHEAETSNVERRQNTIRTMHERWEGAVAENDDHSGEAYAAAALIHELMAYAGIEEA